MKNRTGLQYLGSGMKIALAGVVLVYLGLHSLEFFFFAFGDDGFTPYLGFGLTGGAFLVYLAVFKWMAHTPISKAVSLTMIVVCLVGELVTAGFGFQVGALRSQGLSFTAEELNNMINAVKILALLHGIALVLDFAGDDVVKFFEEVTEEKPIPAPREWVRKDAETEGLPDDGKTFRK